MQLLRLGENVGLVQDRLPVAGQPQELEVRFQHPTAMTEPSGDVKEPTSHSESPFNYL